MAGTSLTLFWLDDELEPLWDAPVDTPAYRRGSVAARGTWQATPTSTRLAEVEAAIPRASDESRAPAVRVLAALASRDGRHRRQRRASSAGSTRSPATATTASACSAASRAAATPRQPPWTAAPAPEPSSHRAADAWSDRAGGTSGALWGVILRAVGRGARRRRPPDGHAVAAGVAAAHAASS